MLTDIWLFSIFLLITGILIFILVFFIITLSGITNFKLNLSLFGKSAVVTIILCLKAFLYFLTNPHIFYVFVDLECDYLNAQECCGRLNFWNIPKLWLQLMIVAMMVMSGHWVLIILNIPVSVWLVRRFHWVPRGNIGNNI